MTAGKIAIRRPRERLARFFYGDCVFSGLNLNAFYDFWIGFGFEIVHNGLECDCFYKKSRSGVQNGANWLEIL